MGTLQSRIQQPALLRISWQSLEIVHSANAVEEAVRASTAQPAEASWRMLRQCLVQQSALLRMRQRHFKKS